MAIAVGILGYEGVAGINITGPLGALANARVPEGRALPYDVFIIAPGRQFTTDAGILINSHRTLDESFACDTIIIPGGSGMRDPATIDLIAGWLRQEHARFRRLATVCSGIFALAASGLLRHRRVTTHWKWATLLAQKHPELQVEESAIVLQDGRFYSSAGATAGVDLTLRLIREDYGHDVAREVARVLLVYPQRDGGQEQYSDPACSPSSPPIGRMGELIQWLSGNLAADLKVELLASRATLTPSSFIQEFKSATGVTPALFIKNLRMNVARRKLEAGSPVSNVAREVGYQDALYFAQEFKRRFGALPDDHQRRFAAATPEEVEEQRYHRPRLASFQPCRRQASRMGDFAGRKVAA